MAAKQKRYSEEFKAMALQLLSDSGKTGTAVAQELGIPIATLYYWRASKEDPDAAERRRAYKEEYNAKTDYYSKNKERQREYSRMRYKDNRDKILRQRRELINAPGKVEARRAQRRQYYREETGTETWVKIEFPDGEMWRAIATTKVEGSTKSKPLITHLGEIVSPDELKAMGGVVVTGDEDLVNRLIARGYNTQTTMPSSRPALAEADRRRTHVNVIIAHCERERIRRHASALGLSMSQYIRQLIRADLDRSEAAPDSGERGDQYENQSED